MTAPTEHLANPATFDCQACERPWPCDPAREALATTMDGLALGIYMADALYRACGALPSAAPAELYERFLSWIRPAHPGPPAPGQRTTEGNISAT